MTKVSPSNSTDPSQARPGMVFVVDDDEQVRRSIVQLGRSVGLHVVAFDSADAFLKTDLSDVVGCIVTDVNMPGMTGLELQAELNEAGVHLPLIVITGVAKVKMAVQALKCGAFDFIEKPFPPQTLVEVIQRAIQVHATDRETIIQRAEITGRIANLSDREMEVLEHLISGSTTKRIASRLKISLTTVDYHRNNILKKMGFDNLVELTRAVTLAAADVEV